MLDTIPELYWSSYSLHAFCCVLSFFLQPKVTEFGIDKANMFEFWDVSYIAQKDLVCVYGALFFSGWVVAIHCGLPLDYPLQ